jgi:HlyD family secretion protein
VQQKELRKPLSLPPLSRTLIVLGIASVVTMGAGLLYFNRSQTTKNTPVTVPKIPIAPTVNALGRLEPRGEVIKISAPSNPGGNGSRVLQILVEQGEKVKAGQTVAILDSRDRLQANLAEALSTVEVAKSRLNQVKAGAKQGEIIARQATVSRLQAELSGQILTQDGEMARLQAQLQGEIAMQQATINRLEAELKGQRQTLQATSARIAAEKSNAQNEVQRFEKLFKEGVISSQEVERRRLSVETSTQQLVESQANQNRTITTLQEQIQEAKANREKTVTTLRIQIREAKANREKTIATLQQQINEAKATLNQTKEVRPTDVANAALPYLVG